MGNHLSNPSKFSASSIPTQNGRVFIITGANTGLGFETSKVLASKGATVVMVVRNVLRSRSAIDNVKEIAEKCNGKVLEVEMDLGSLQSIKHAVQSLEQLNLSGIHCLINNAGVMRCPHGKTQDGFETQFGTNHLGPFAFTALLYPLIVAMADNDPSVSPENPIRIVNLTSNYHAKGPKEGILFDNLNWDNKKEPKYDPSLAYGHSKFANVVFTKELQRLLDAKGEKRIITVCVHPGFVDTELTRHIEAQNGRWIVKLYKLFAGALTPQVGALTQLYASVSPDIVTNNWKAEYFVPVAKRSDLDKEAPTITDDLQSKLWNISEQLTGATFKV